tara:strand:- start:7040 stop:7381 length:342 start_codon:yes stop_codon:yes gene_type:complete
MPSLFDGFGSMLADVFGDAVLHTPREPQGSVPVTITARFRLKPIEVLEADGSAVLIHEPTLRVPEPVASTIKTDDLIRPEGEALYRVLNRHEGGSPDVERSVIFKLREVSENV